MDERELEAKGSGWHGDGPVGSVWLQDSEGTERGGCCPEVATQEGG